VSRAALTEWSPERLNRLFKRYRDRFWPGRLRRYHVQIAPLDDAHGECDWRSSRKITIDVASHRNDWHVRTTLLHEMCHAAAPGGHHSKFFAEIERLLEAGAPVQVSVAETGGPFNCDAIPERFPLARQRFRITQAKATKALLRGFSPKAQIRQITYEDICREIEDAALLEGLTWRVLWPVVANEHGLLDVDGKPAPSISEQQVRAFRRAYRRGRRNWLEEQRAQAR
jgi:hypothetical protein